MVDSTGFQAGWFKNRKKKKLDVAGNQILADEAFQGQE